MEKGNTKSASEKQFLKSCRFTENKGTFLLKSFSNNKQLSNVKTKPYFKN